MLLQPDKSINLIQLFPVFHFPKLCEFITAQHMLQDSIHDKADIKSTILTISEVDAGLESLFSNLKPLWHPATLDDPIKVVEIIKQYNLDKILIDFLSDSANPLITNINNNENTLCIRIQDQISPFYIQCAQNWLNGLYGFYPSLSPEGNSILGEESFINHAKNNRSCQERGNTY